MRLSTWESYLIAVLRRDHPARQATVVDEQYALRLEGVAERLDAGRDDRSPDSKRARCAC